MPSPAMGLAYDTHPDVYEPSDDTLLLLEVLPRIPPGRLLDLGTGAGLVAIQAALQGHDVVATDVNPHALRLARANARKNSAGIRIVYADLTRGLRVGNFDAIVMNPPYLPTRADERVPGPLNDALDGGREGRKVFERLLGELPADTPPVWMVVSSLQDSARLHAFARAAGFDVRVESERKLPWETISVLRLSRALEHATRKG